MERRKMMDNSKSKGAPRGGIKEVMQRKGDMKAAPSGMMSKRMGERKSKR